MQVDDLAVVLVGPAVLERIEQGLLHVVDVAPAVVGRIDLDFDGERSLEWLHAPGREDRHDALAETAALAADQRSRPHPPPVMVDRRRVGQFDLEHHERLQGGVLLACGCALAAGAGASFFA